MRRKYFFWRIIMTTEDERLFSMLIYLLSFVFLVIAPLINWILKKYQSDFVDHHGREYFNFLLSFTIYTFISMILILVLVGILLLIAIAISATILTIIAAVRAYDGERYRFPLVIRFFS